MGGGKVKKFVISLLLLVGMFTAGTAFANNGTFTAGTEWYTVNIESGGAIYANAGGVAGLPGSAPTTPVQNLDASLAPFTTVNFIDALLPAPPPIDQWTAAGWWTFSVTGSSGQGWNNVFGINGGLPFGGMYNFTADWNLSQLGSLHFETGLTTFNAMYGKWIENDDPSVWTYFGLYVAPNSGAAQSAAPTGIFAFLAGDGNPDPSGIDLNRLYEATANGPITAAPEPATMLLLGLGLMGIAGIRKKFKQS
jgi:hypothetical protein